MPDSIALHPEMQILVDVKADLPPATTLEEMRANWNIYAARMRRPHPADMKVDDRRVPGKGGAIPVRIYRPAAAAAKAPCVLYFHGGGFMKGDLDSSDTVAWGLAQETGAVVVSVDYRLAPEHTYPAAFDDCFSVLEDVARNAGRYGVDPARIAVSGDSAGGNLAAVAALAARDAGRSLAAQLLIYPVTDMSRLEGESYTACGDGYGLTAGAMVWFRDHYLTNVQAARDWRVSPLLATDLGRLPPALVVTAEFDVLRSEGEAYAKRLAEAGVPTRLARYDGMIHGFASMAGVLDVGRQVRTDMAQWLQDTLGG